MKRLHAIAGLPRSGSTALGAILSQNPAFYVSPTSLLCHTIDTIRKGYSGSPEFKAMLARGEGEARLEKAIRAFVRGWYPMPKVIFDKGRGWGHNALVLKKLFPSSKIILCVRDLRAIFGNIEKHEAKSPLLTTATTPVEQTQYDRADKMFSSQGLVGMPLNGIEDALRKRHSHVYICQYEPFVEDPEKTIHDIYGFLGEKKFKHDFKNIPEETEDSGVYDALLLNKFPHKVRKEVKKPDVNEWKKFISKDIADLISRRYEGYQKTFGFF